IETEADMAEKATRMAKETGRLQVHSHFNGEYAGRPGGVVELVAGGYFDSGFWGRKVAYPAYVGALAAAGYDGYIDWEFCHPARENGKPADIDYVHNQTKLALEYMRGLRALVFQGAQTLTADARDPVRHTN